MNQKITLRFADHVLTFTLTEAEVSEVERHMRRKWLYEFTRGDGDFLVNFDKVLWMKISPTGDPEPEQETVAEQVEEYRALFGPLPMPSLGGEHGSL